MEFAGGVAGGFKRQGEGVDGFGRAGDDGEAGGVERGEVEGGWEKREEFGFGEADGEHGTGSHGGHETAAGGDELDGVFKGKDAREGGSHIFADAVAQHGRRRETEGEQKPGEGVGRGEEGRLGVGGVVEVGGGRGGVESGGLGVEKGEMGGIGRMGLTGLTGHIGPIFCGLEKSLEIHAFGQEEDGAGVEGFLVGGFVGVESVAHAGVLGALTGKEENEGRVGGFEVGQGRSGAELGDGFIRRGGGNGAAVGERLPAGLEGPGGVGEEGWGI